MKVLAVLGAATGAILTSLSPAPATAQAATIQVEVIKAEADRLLAAAYPADCPGAAVIITRGGRVIYAAGRGLADVEARQPITPETVFRLGSITKQFTAAVILQLAAEGRISLDDPVSRFLPDQPAPGASATVRQLLNHTSGIGDFSKVPGWLARNRTRSFTTAELLAISRELPARAQPGQAWEYNNGGYVLLGAVIEAVTGRPWHQAVVEKIARPLGLRRIAYGGSGASPASARGYTEDNRSQRLTPLSDMSVPHAAGGLVGSVSDLARWAQALHHGRVVSPSLYQEMSRPAQLVSGKAEPYGFGLRIGQLRGRAALGHGGAIAGFDTDSLYLPSEDLFVAVFANSDDPATDPSVLVRRLAALAVGEPIPTFRRAAVNMKAIEPLFGLYEGPNRPARRFFSRDGKLYLGRGDDEQEVAPGGDDRFFASADQLGWIRFVRREGGGHLMEVHRLQASAPERATRVGPVPPPLAIGRAKLERYVGVYATEAPVLTIALREDGRLTLAPAGQSALEMRAISDTEFRIDNAGMRVFFHEENGEVNRMTVYRGARELHGRRIKGGQEGGG